MGIHNQPLTITSPAQDDLHPVSILSWAPQGASRPSESSPNSPCTRGGPPEEARRLLDEAQRIAERGPMPLSLADVYLHRARLFRDKQSLAQARALIDHHAYHRRADELADAEAAAPHWPTSPSPS